VCVVRITFTTTLTTTFNTTCVTPTYLDFNGPPQLPPPMPSLGDVDGESHRTFRVTGLFERHLGGPNNQFLIVNDDEAGVDLRHGLGAAEALLSNLFMK
jgi:hypothetical protein